MKLIKRLLVLTLCFSLMIPNIPVHAATEEELNGGVQRAEDKELSVNVEAVQQSIEGLPPGVQHSIMTGVEGAARQEEVQYEAEKKKQVNGTRVHGVDVYLAEISGADPNNPAAITSACENIMMTGSVIMDVGFIKLGGKDGEIATIGNGKQTWNKMISMDGKDEALFFEVMLELGIPTEICDRYLKMLQQFKAGNSSTVPVLIAYPALSNYSTSISLLDAGRPDLSVGTIANCTEAAIVLEQATGSTMGYTMLTGEGLGAGLSVTTVGGVSSRTGNYLVGGYATPILDPDDGGGGGGGGLLQANFYVKADPKRAGNDWTTTSTVTGTYILYSNITQKEIAAASDGYLDITVTANFADGNYPNAKLVAGAPTLVLNNQTMWEDLVSKDPKSQMSLSGTVSTFKIPVSHVNKWNETAFVYTVPITGGSATGEEEEARPASFTVTVEGSSAVPNTSFATLGFTASGNKGFNYTSWLPKGEDPIPDSSYDKHTVDIPVGESLVVANTAKDGERSWDASLAIPSTENVSIKTGAEAGMADAYGWMCARPLEGGIVPGNRTMGSTEDVLGSSISGQAAERTITLKGMVTDCWGSDNPVCKLSDASKVIKSNSITASDGSVYDQDPKTCGGHSCGSGSVGGGTYNNPKHKATKYECGNHYNGKPGWDTYDEQHPGNCGGSNENIQYDAFGNETSRSCACTSCSSGSVSPNSHDCSFNVTVHDSIGEDYIGQKGMPKTGTATGVNASHEYGLITISNQPQSGIDIYWKISWKPSVDEQYYIVTYDVWNVDRASGASGCHSDARGSSGNKAWGPSGTHYTGTWPTSDTVLCNDYTHGTGYSKKCYENMVHKGTHYYTITYTETVDAYVYRTIENASVFNLTHISLDNVHQITRDSGKDIDGTEYTSGTFNAPMDVDGGDRAVSVPDAVGYMWRCLGENHGEYKSGNGRILWEAWVDSLAKAPAAGNVTIERPDNYFLGDVTVTIKAVQDSEWATTIKDEDTWDTMSDAGVTNNGELMDHIHDHNSTSTLKYETTASDTKYLNGPVGDQTRSGSGSGKTATENDDSQHQGVVLKELKHIMNYWSGMNSGLRADSGGTQLFYKANIISDNLTYGGLELTNSVLDDAYAVDGEGEEAGVALFNIHATPSNVSCGPSVNNNTGEKEAYRQHQNAFAANQMGLKDQLKNDFFSTASLPDGGSMGLFGGAYSDGGGGTTALTATTVGQMTTGMSTFGLYCSATKGDVVLYGGVLEPIDNHDNHSGSGITTIEAKNTSSTTTTQSFAGYWRDFTYNSIGGSDIYSYVNGVMSNIGGGSVTDVGTNCISEYGTLAISNIPLVDWVPNYTWYTGQVGSHYTPNVLAEGAIPDDGINVPRTSIQDNHNKVAGNEIIAPCGSGGTPYLNAIKIYNPLSAENDYVIGAQVGKFEDSLKVTDDTEHDQRLDDLGNYLRYDEDYAKDTKPYVVQSQYLWSWLSPFGNFASVGGSGSSNTADRSIDGNGVIQRNAGHSGYVNNMQFGKWIGCAGISYPFIAGLDDTLHTTKPHVELSVNKMRIAHASTGNGGAKLAGPAKNNKLNNYVDPDKFYWGNAFAVTNTSNVFESDMDNDTVPTTKVKMLNYGINPYLYDSDSYLSGKAMFGYRYAETDNTNDMLANAVFKYDPVNLVGSIGNVTIHDVEDFRFSNYFKEPTTNWLIDGVIKEVDINKPIRVVSSIKDICFNDVNYYVEGGKILKISDGTESTKFVPGHATLGISIFNMDWSYGGMAGYYDPLPLVPQYNVIDEYRTEAVRLGYKSFISVDTIGQYQSYLYKDEVRPDGPGDTDTRSKYLAVESEYYLYDMEDGKFYDVDLWSGATGGKERIYNGITKKTEQTTHAGAIYQNVREDVARRNIGLFEEAITDLLTYASDVTVDSIFEEYTFVYSNSHYIGRPGSLRLDNRDLSYIGSESNFSEHRFWNQSDIAAAGFNNNGQRYHFKDGLTSTTVITEPLGSNPTQAQIMDANQKVREEHPYSVLVQFMNFTAVGEVWTIKHNGSAVMDDTFTIFDTNGDDPDNPDDDNKYLPKDWQASVIRPHNTVKYQGTATYNPITGVQSGTIDKDSTPIVVYQAYHTSADDRTVSGTH